MSVPSIVLDGAAPYGSRIITINSVPYKVNNIRIARPVSEANDRDTDGSPGRNRYTEGVATLTGEVQLATGSTAYPKFGDTFPLNVDPNYGSETWIVFSAEYAEDNEDTSIRVAPITCRKASNPSDITTVA